ncbi:MAG: hypothetical protein JO278_04555, partial [Dyella sp.]|nr:hypothetical protein [Dyella sp.]
MALLGHRAWCDACDSLGIIVAGAPVPDPMRLTDFTSGGAKQAVGGDLVACKCKRPPRIIPEFGRKWTITVDGAAESSVGQVAKPYNEPSEDYDEHFVLLDQRTGRPLAGFAWGMETPDGEREGCTGADGKTDIICGHEGIHQTGLGPPDRNGNPAMSLVASFLSPKSNRQGKVVPADLRDSFLREISISAAGSRPGT